ncbi:MAG TPA: VTT domain-containing protein [Acidobacteriaceae bacterium]|jgi:membrane protein YqaA with SNARE-associated domain|nr:VTT domain-containing protein [Acidobacteriaceae bacterium]
MRLPLLPRTATRAATRTAIFAALLAALVALPVAAQHAQMAPHPVHHGLVHFFFHLGLIGLFLVSIVDSSFVPLPIPGVTDIMLILYAAGHTNPILLVTIATIGSAIGGLLSHAAGQAGGMAFLKKHVPAGILSRVTTWMEKHAILSVSLPALLPPPMPLSPFVLAAGAVHMSRKKFMWAFTISRLVRHCIAVWIGVRYGRAFLRLWSHFSDKWATTILIIIWTSILLSVAFAIWKLVRTSRDLHLAPAKRKHPQADAAPTN